MQTMQRTVAVGTRVPIPYGAWLEVEEVVQEATICVVVLVNPFMLNRHGEPRRTRMSLTEVLARLDADLRANGVTPPKVTR